MLLAVLAVAGGLLADDRKVITPAAPGPSETPSELTRADAAGDLLLDLADALSEGDRSRVLALAAPGEPSARRALATMQANADLLDVEDLALRFVDEDPDAVDPATRRELGAGAWGADVALTWRLAGYDRAVGDMETSFTFVDTGDGVAFGATGDEAGPLWLVERLFAHRSPRALVMVTDRSVLGRYTALAERAVRDVRAVLPRWRGRLVVEVAASAEQLHQVLGADPGTYTSIAAVTATVDGSSSPASPVHILVNPEVFSGLGADGAQIVMSHEATHVATGAATSAMPLWLLEGFADYVALARSDLPVDVTASQILSEVRRNGPPRRLPDQKAFDPSNKLLGTSYEAAWLAARLLAEEYGERRLVGFYDTVDAGASTEEAFAELGTTEAAFTRRWRDYLRELAG